MSQCNYASREGDAVMIHIMNTKIIICSQWAVKEMVVRIESMVIRDHQNSKCKKRKTLQMYWEEGEKRNRGQFAQGEGINSDRNPPVIQIDAVNFIYNVGKLKTTFTAVRSQEINWQVLSHWNDNSLGSRAERCVRTVTDTNIRGSLPRRTRPCWAN